VCRSKDAPIDRAPRATSRETSYIIHTSLILADREPRTQVQGHTRHKHHTIIMNAIQALIKLGIAASILAQGVSAADTANLQLDTISPQACNQLSNPELACYQNVGLTVGEADSDGLMTVTLTSKSGGSLCQTLRGTAMGGMASGPMKTMDIVTTHPPSCQQYNDCQSSCGPGGWGLGSYYCVGSSTTKKGHALTWTARLDPDDAEIVNVEVAAFRILGSQSLGLTICKAKFTADTEVDFGSGEGSSTAAIVMAVLGWLSVVALVGVLVMMKIKGGKTQVKGPGPVPGAGEP
jgi:hypothetical protein